MANTPSSNVLELAAALRRMAAGVSARATAGDAWAGPTADELNTAADELESRSTATDSAYAAYKQRISARDEHRLSTAVPMYRQVVQAAYLAVGKDSEQLRDFGLEPLTNHAENRIPVAPGGVTVRETSTQSVLVDWDPVAGADRYHVFYGTDMAQMSLYGSATASELEVRGLTEGTKYFFYVTAVNGTGESGPSNFTSRRTL